MNVTDPLFVKMMRNVRVVILNANRSSTVYDISEMIGTINTTQDCVESDQKILKILGKPINH
jgi:hypothetical protein